MANTSVHLHVNNRKKEEVYSCWGQSEVLTELLHAQIFFSNLSAQVLPLYNGWYQIMSTYLACLSQSIRERVSACLPSIFKCCYLQMYVLMQLSLCLLSPHSLFSHSYITSHIQPVSERRLGRGENKMKIVWMEFGEAYWRELSA